MVTTRTYQGTGLSVANDADIVTHYSRHPRRHPCLGTFQPKSSVSSASYLSGQITVSQARVLVDYKVRIEPPKSRNGKRTLPLDDELVSALTDLRKRQARESETAGHAYRAGLGGCAHGRFRNLK